MPLSRPQFGRKISAPADLPMAATEVSRGNTLRTLDNLQAMGYRNVWVRCDDLNANILAIAWAGGWRVCDAKGSQVRLTLDNITPPDARARPEQLDDFDTPRIAHGAVVADPLPPIPPFVKEARRGSGPNDAIFPAHADAPARVHPAPPETPQPPRPAASPPPVFVSPWGGDQDVLTPLVSTPRAWGARRGSPLAPDEVRRGSSTSSRGSASSGPLSPGLSRGSRVFGHAARPQSPGGVTPSAHLTGRSTPSLKVQSPEASRPSTILSEQSIGYFNFKGLHQEAQTPSREVFSPWVPELAEMSTHAGLREFDRPISVSSTYSQPAEDSEDSFGFDRIDPETEDESRTIRFGMSTPTVMFTGVRRPSAPTFIAMPSPGLVRSDRMGSDPTGAKLKNRPAMRIKWPNVED